MNHNLYMHRCLQLAEAGMGKVSPNPMVGCVIVHNNTIIGEGYHRSYGQAHAEVNAINAVSNKLLLSESVLYVNLEPCSHYGKTPPCADLIIEKGIKKVVVAALDPNPLVEGRGIEKLKAAGVETIVGVLANESRELNRRFYCFHNQYRPYIILKWAKTLDGYIDRLRHIGDGQQPEWITNEQSRFLVHKWRTEEAAFLVGTRTALLDNPMLTARMYRGKQPLRIAIDIDNVLPKTLHIFNNHAPSLVFGNIVRNDVDFEFLDLNQSLPTQICKALYRRNILSLVVEGGRQTLEAFINEGYWDESRIFTGNIIFGKGVPSPELYGELQSIEMLGDTELKIFRNDA